LDLYSVLSWTHL